VQRAHRSFGLSWAQAVAGALSEALLPRRCASCRRVGRSPCVGCIAGALRLDLDATPIPFGCASITAPFAFCGSVRALILAAKYQQRPSGLTFLAGQMGAACSQAGVRADLVTWVPAAPARRARRGYDQSQLLAEHLAAVLGLPVERLLLRRADRIAQTGLSAHDRERHAQANLYRPSSGYVRSLRSVLLVDDVVTTGATLRAASAALHELGARDVHAAVAAATL
jgi:ComF family protein